jgi:hypothetical protein
MGNVAGVPASPHMGPVDSEHVIARRRPYYDCHLTTAELAQLRSVLDTDSVAWATPISVVVDTIALLIRKFKAQDGAVYACARTIGEGLVLVRRTGAQGKFNVCVVDFGDPASARYDAANFIHGYVPLSADFAYN